MRILSADETRQALPFQPLITALRAAITEYRDGTIICPERLVVPTADQRGTVLSMVACSPDLIAHKLLTIFPENTDLPTLQGQVTCLDGADGRFLFAMDGITATERRTAAVSLLGLSCLRPANLHHVLLIGTGAQAAVHLEALNELYPGLSVSIRGRNKKRIGFLVEGPYPALRIEVEQDTAYQYDAVITVTSSRNILFDASASSKTLVIGVGAYRPDMIEIGPEIVLKSLCVVDDPIGAPHEAGDILQAGKNWSEVRSLADFLQNRPPEVQPIFFKSVGCAAWDLAACRLASKSLLQGQKH
ncbi:delta(1)-pyrroline-2-carboxylate reductase family protein [Gluconobacter kondonii]|uniref:Ornithine cyclodeaminase n=1 Tax=Gluconobacter kondonii TaxID=941463 RepID=A0ABQ5WVV0_9PROT|nr:delta(1)-pyrroline-2-carboxylate reductase family protein [Gluconobacter kondonii]MCP1237798.1 delta(1)-pyrroline-2-carboxylate reductase family protein [Gluconobacter kondonii]GBR35547.1 ornithine cyclodeaminase [Gluconobacter kondonii NBRC 3266]GLQ67338.1 ornithine cyclodeaminase [Gluconobacter kondonii]